MISPWTIYQNSKQNSGQKSQNAQQTTLKPNDKNISIQQLLLKPKNSSNKKNKKIKTNNKKYSAEEQSQRIEKEDNQQGLAKEMENDRHNENQGQQQQLEIDVDYKKNKNKEITQNIVKHLEEDYKNLKQKPTPFQSIQIQHIDKKKSNQQKKLKNKKISPNKPKKSQSQPQNQQSQLHGKNFLKNITSNYNPTVQQDYSSLKQHKYNYQYQKDNNIQYNISNTKNLTVGQRMIRQQKNTTFNKMNQIIILKCMKMALRDQDMMQKQMDENITSVMKKIHPQVFSKIASVEIFPKARPEDDLLQRLLKSQQEKMTRMNQLKKMELEQKKIQQIQKHKNTNENSSSQHTKATYKIKQKIINIYNLSNQKSQIKQIKNNIRLMMKQDLSINKSIILKPQTKDAPKQKYKKHHSISTINNSSNSNTLDVKQYSQKQSLIKSLIQKHIASRKQQKNILMNNQKQQNPKNNQIKISPVKNSIEKKQKYIILSNKNSRKNTTSHLLQILTNNIISQNDPINKNKTQNNAISHNANSNKNDNIVDKIFSKKNYNHSRIKRQYSSIDNNSNDKYYTIDNGNIKQQQLDKSMSIDQIMNEDNQKDHEIKLKESRSKEELKKSNNELKKSIENVSYKKSILYPERKIYQYQELNEYSSAILNNKKYKSLISQGQLQSLIQNSNLETQNPQTKRHHPSKNPQKPYLNPHSHQNSQQKTPSFEIAFDNKNMKSSLLKFSDHNIIKQLKHQVDQNNRIKNFNHI